MTLEHRLSRIDLADYPHGVRCACCQAEFTHGDAVVHRELGSIFTTPTCAFCSSTDAVLCKDHPLRDPSAVALGAEGMVLDA